MTEQTQSMSSQYAVGEIPAYETLYPTVSAQQEDDIIHKREIVNDDGLPLYVEDQLTSAVAINRLAATLQVREGLKLPIQKYPEHENNDEGDHKYDGQIRQVIYSYFNSIRNGNVELVAASWGSKLVTTETTNVSGETPLLAAVGAGHVHMVRYLLDVGAGMDALGITGTSTTRRIRDGKQKKLHTYRTPLQYAAELGNLPMVKLLLERGADDAAVAPDGQLALRLAAANGHREIVEYLPARRGGGYRRWKVKHSKALYRCKKAGYKIYVFTKFFVWDVPKFFIWEVPKFFLWTVPKHAIVRPLVKQFKWLREHWDELPQIMAEARKRTIKRLGEFGRGTVKCIKGIPNATWEFAKGCAELLKTIVLFIWRGIKAIPHALHTLLTWLWNGTKRLGSAIGGVFKAIFSFIHTVLGAIFSFFQRVTLKDVFNAFLACLYAIFVAGPKKLWEWICSFGKMFLKVMKALFGGLGECIGLLAKGCFWLVTYIPRKIWEIVRACGSSIKNGGTEVLVWVNPKRM